MGEQVSAADYDPCFDRREDEQKRVWNLNHVPETVEEVDEDEEDVDDMFAITTTEKKAKKVKKVVVSVYPVLSQFGQLNHIVEEARCASSNNDHDTRFCCGSRRILHGHSWRAARWRTVPSIFIARKGHVRQRCSRSSATG